MDGGGEERREVIEMPVEPRQRTHRVGFALRRIAGWICSMENTRVEERSRHTRDGGADWTGQIGIGVMARAAVGAIDHGAAIGGAQLARLGAGRGERNAYHRRDRDAENARE